MESKASELLNSVTNRLSDSQKEKAKKCNTLQELTEFLTEEGIELSDDMLEKIAGGCPIYGLRR